MFKYIRRSLDFETIRIALFEVPNYSNILGAHFHCGQAPQSGQNILTEKDCGWKSHCGFCFRQYNFPTLRNWRGGTGCCKLQNQAWDEPQWCLAVISDGWQFTNPDLGNMHVPGEFSRQPMLCLHDPDEGDHQIVGDQGNTNVLQESPTRHEQRPPAVVGWPPTALPTASFIELCFVNRH